MISLKWVVGAAALSTCLASGAFATSPNLFVNGDFEAGNSGFASSYTYSPHFIAGSKTYDIVSDPKLSHGGAVSFHDHTTGTGLMLAANGAATADVSLWSESATLQPDAVYFVEGWMLNWSSAPTVNSNFALKANGTTIGTFQSPKVNQQWSPFQVRYRPTESGATTFSLIDQTLDGYGNDFAIDDLSLRGFYSGDATLDGTVDFADLLVVATHYGTVLNQTWETGDFDGDTSVTFNDLLLLARNYNRSTGLPAATPATAAFQADWALAQSMVPEPASLLLVPALLGVLRRRR